MTDSLVPPPQDDVDAPTVSVREQALRRWGAGGERIDGHAGELLDALAGSELMPGLRPEDYAAIGDTVTTRHVAAGDRLVSRDDEADCLFVVMSGRLEAEIETAHGAQQLAAVGVGGVVGEIGLLAGDTRSATVRAITDSDVVEISSDGFRRLLAAHPAHAEELTRRATERLRRTQVIDHITNLFGVVDPTVLEVIEQLIEWVNVPAGTRLFAQGEEGDAAYLVAAGRLRAFRQTAGVEVEIGEIGRAELVGEMALLDGEPRGASLYAVRDSQLIRFSRAAYDELLQRYPRVGLEVAQIALRRSRSPVDRDRPRRLSVAVVPITSGIDVRTFISDLTAALGPDARRVTSAQIDEELGREGIAQISDDDVGTLRLAYHLEELENHHPHLVYEIDDGFTSWSRRALRWADHILLVADAEADPQPGQLEQDLWALIASHHHPKVSLALLHPSGTQLPSGTMAWLETRVLASHHHLRRGDREHMARLARLLAGTGTSLVLGGGGARGFAQLGALEVFEERRAPIDMIGGTSIGSIMAVGPALGWTAAEHRRKAVDAFRKLFDYTLPTTSILRGERITAKLQSIIGDVDIADLWIPYFCVSTNLTHATATYHDRGSLVTAIRASIAIPGVLPPVPLDGDLLVDGGVLDNVPVDEMRRRNPTGTVVAIDVAPVDGPVAERDYGLSVSGFRTLFRRDGRSRPPNLLSTMVRSSILASVRDRQRVVRDGVADLYLDVEVDGGGALDFSTAEQIADAGEASTREVLTSWFAHDGTAPLGYVRTTPARRSVIDPARRSRGGGVLLLTLRDLQHRLARFGAVVIGVAVVFSLLFLMTGLTEQFHREPTQTVASFGADGWLLRDGASGAFTSAATMPADTVDLVADAGAHPIVLARHSITEGSLHTDVVVVGFEAGGLGEPVLKDGRLPNGPGEVVIDDASELAVGEEALIGTERYVVTGRTDRMTLFAGMPFVFMDLGAAQDLLYRGQDLATAILLDETPESAPDGFAVLSDEAVAEDAMRPLEKSISSVNMIRILLWFVAAMIIGTMTYLSALERRRDVAVLKAVGGSTVRLGASIALQGALIALAAAAIASVLQRVMAPVFPLEVTVPSSALIQVPVIAVLVALAAGSVGLRKAVRVDPALAFSGPGS
jgi:predicted acylesterase/phospholipase RssA/CRP-like cAMP-binding protein